LLEDELVVYELLTDEVLFVGDVLLPVVDELDVEELPMA
jgi:hypothetical protein